MTIAILSGCTTSFGVVQLARTAGFNPFTDTIESGCLIVGEIPADVVVDFKDGKCEATMSNTKGE